MIDQEIKTSLTHDFNYPLETFLRIGNSVHVRYPHVRVDNRAAELLMVDDMRSDILEFQVILEDFQVR